MAGTMADVISAIAAALDEIPEAGTVLPYLPEALVAAAGATPIVSSWPALIVDPGPPRVSAMSNVREWTWPIHIVVVVEPREGDLAAETADALVWPERVVAKLDSKRTFNGLLARTVAYDDPAASAADELGAVGPIPFRDRTYMGTIVHAVCTVERSPGGF